MYYRSFNHGATLRSACLTVWSDIFQKAQTLGWTSILLYFLKSFLAFNWTGRNRATKDLGSKSYTDLRVYGKASLATCATVTHIPGPLLLIERFVTAGVPIMQVEHSQPRKNSFTKQHESVKSVRAPGLLLPMSRLVHITESELKRFYSYTSFLHLQAKQ